MLSMTIRVHEKKIQGKTRFYPVGENALIFARISGNKTLTPEIIIFIRSLGYEVIFVETQGNLF